MTKFAEDARHVNRYECKECRIGFYCINLAAGVTPMFVSKVKLCDCKTPIGEGVLTSRGYFLNPCGKLEVTYAWIRPSTVYFRGLDSSIQHHVLHGGLLLEKFPSDALQRHADLCFDGITSGAKLLEYLAIYYKRGPGAPG